MEFLSLLYTVLLVAICLLQALLLYRSGKPAPRQDDEALKEWVRQQLDAQSKLFAQKQAELAGRTTTPCAASAKRCRPLCRV